MSMVEVVKHGRDPSRWGSYKWLEQEEFIQSLPERPESDPRHALAIAFKMLYNLGCFLPCKDCRCHYERARDDVLAELSRAGVGLADRVTRIRLHVFWWSVHDRVNKRLEKPHAQRLSWQQYAARYSIPHRREGGAGDDSYADVSVPL
jgi:hypothetical protein